MLTKFQLLKTIEMKKNIRMNNTTEIKRGKNLSGYLRDKKTATMKKLLLAVFMLGNITLLAQQDPLFTQYMFNKLVVNPAYAGSRESTSIELLDRYQWVGIEGAPRTMTASIHTALNDNKVGLGAYVYRDVIGPTVSQGFMATYAYRIQTSKGYLSMGIQGGFKYFDYDWNMFYTQYPDYVFLPQEIERFVPDVNIGFYYQTNRFFAGISSKQLLENEYGVGESDGKSTFSTLSRHFYLMSGFAAPINDKMVFRPSFLVKYANNAPVQADFNASILFDNIFWVGMSYRTDKAVTFLAEFNILKNISLGYAFDLYVNELRVNEGGSHEIRLGIEIDKKSRMKTPRYF
jgi:type IX secretion system PorP/SprF family membrane protein